MPKQAFGRTQDTLTPYLHLEHSEGVFTPHRELSDGDITEDSGTGNSLDSEEGNKARKVIKKSDSEDSEYQHKSRIPVREQLNAFNKQIDSKPKTTVKPTKKPPKTKLPQPAPVFKGIRNTEEKSYPVERALKPADAPSLRPVKPPVKKHNIKEQPVSHVTLSPVNTLTPPVVGDRHTLLMQKPNRSLKTIAKPAKPPKPLLRPPPVLELPRKKVAAKKPAINFRRLPRDPHKAKQISPRRMTMPIQILESPSDSETNEVFRQQPVVAFTQKSKPAGNRNATRNLPPARGKRNNGIRSLGKVY